MVELHRRFPQPPERVLEAIDEAAEMWGAEWQPAGAGGNLLLPIVRGLRHGVLQITLALEPTPEGTSLSCRIQRSTLEINRSALAILILGGLGGLTVVFWPLSPKILQLAPLGAVLAFVAWLLVVSRLRNSGAEDFFSLVGDLAKNV